MSGRMLLVQGCSPEASGSLVQVFIENHLPQDIDVTDAKMQDGKATLTLSRDISERELHEIQEMLLRTPLQGARLHLSRLAPCEFPATALASDAPATILASELPPDISEEYLELYFECEKYGGGDVDSVKLYPDHHAAVIRFCNPATVEAVLRYGRHQISEKSITVESCSPLWKPNRKRTAKPVDTMEFLHPKRQKAQPMDQTPVAAGKDENPYASSSPATGPVLLPPEEERPSTSMTPVPAFPTWAPAKEPISLPEAGDRMLKPATSVASTPAAPTVCIPAADPPPLYKADPEPATIACQDTWEGSAAKYEFVKETIRDKCASLAVKVISDTVITDTADKKVHLILEGTREAINEAKMFMFQEMMNVEERKLKLTQVTAQILQRKSGQSEAEGMMKGLTAKLVDIKGQVSVVGHSDDCIKAARMIEGMFSTDRIKLEDHNQEFMKTDTWKEALRGVQSDDCVNVIQEASCIEFEGIDSHVKDTRTTLLDSLKKHSLKEEMMDVKKGVYRFIKQHMADEMEDIRSKHSIRLRLCEKDRKWFVQYKGCAENVQEAAPAVKKLVSSVAYGTETCGKPGMAKFFTIEKSIGHRLVKSLELSHECAIEIRAGTDSPGPTFYHLIRSPSPGETEGDGAAAALLSYQPPPPPDKPHVECAVKLQKGDIVNFKADVIVNSVANANTDLSKCGAVAASFAKQAGAEMVQEFTTLGGLKCGQVRATMTSGQLACQVVLHASIRAWEGERTYKMMCGVVKECLQQVRSYNLNSIAFPTLGCGRLKYPVRDVARCFREMTAKHGQGLQVSLVAYEDGVYQALADHLQSSGDLPTREYVPLPRIQRRATFKRQPPPTPQAVTFHINAKSQNAIQAVKSELQTIIKDHYSEVEEHNACLEFAEDDDVRKILQQQSKTAIVDLDPEKKMVKFLGEKGSVIAAREKVRGIMKEMKKKQESPDYVRKYFGHKGILQAMLNDNQRVPSHWTKNTGAIGEGIAMDNVLVDVDAKTFGAVDQLVTGSWKQALVGHGKDAVGLAAGMKIQVKKVQRIENPSTYRHYRTGLNFACEEGLKGDFPPITKLDDNSDVLSATLKIPELEAIRTRELNEYFLFHGTKKEVVENIVVQGPDSRFSGTGLFGSGLYLSESSTKADQYADPKTGRSPNGTLLYMVVCRVILGHIYHQQGSAKFKRPPCRTKGCHKDHCSHHERFNSVLGTHKDGGVRLNFREFVVFDNHRAYPEFLVTYTRL